MSRHDDFNNMTEEQWAKFSTAFILRILNYATVDELATGFNVCPCCILPQLLNIHGYGILDGQIVRLN